MAAALYALGVGPSEAFVPKIRTAVPGLRQFSAASPQARHRSTELRMGCPGEYDDDMVVRRVDAIMEVTPMQLVVEYFDHAFEGTPAVKDSDKLEALFSDTSVPNGFSDHEATGEDTFEEQATGEETFEEQMVTFESQTVDPCVQNPGNALPTTPDFEETKMESIDSVAADTAAVQPEVPESPTQAPASRPSNEDAVHVLQRAQAMTHMADEDAAAVIARVNAMMRERERMDLGDGCC